MKASDKTPPRLRTTHRFVILTGLSGSGKTHAIRALEDLGYFCVDNLPSQLIPTFAELQISGPTRRVFARIDLGEDGRGRLAISLPAEFLSLLSCIAYSARTTTLPGTASTALPA